MASRIVFFLALMVVSGTCLAQGDGQRLLPIPHWQNKCDEPEKYQLTPTQICTACENLSALTVRACNLSNWDCGSSAMYAPYDAASCAMPSPCNCPGPP